MIIRRKSSFGERTVEEVQAEIKAVEKDRERVKSHQSDYDSDKAFRLDLKYLDEELEDLRAELGYLQAKENTLGK
jgi:hypothetical protein